MPLQARPFEAADNDAVRQFLRDLLAADRDVPRCWSVLRWDYWVTHGLHNCEWQRLEDVVVLWRTSSGAIAAMANPEGAGQGYFQVHPGHRSPELDRAMLDAMEGQMAASDGAGRRLTAWVADDDASYAALLAAAGYERTEWEEHVRVRRLWDPIPDLPPPPGYRIRPLAPGSGDFPERGIVTHLVFHPDGDPGEAMTATDYDHVRSGPLHRPDLDLVAEAPDGSIAAFATLWFDPANRTADIEPVGTAAAHRGKGVGKALIVEGLRRVRQLGATHAYVGSGEEPAHRLYASVGLRTVVRRVGWRRRWK